MKRIGVIGAKGFMRLSDAPVEILFLSASSDEETPLDILVLNEFSDRVLINKCIQKLGRENILIFNSDDKKLYPSIFKCRSPFITYGFNSKACVTASSVVEGVRSTIQVCVMRSFKSLTNETVLQQEFSVDVNDPTTNTYVVLASVTAALLCGTQVELLNFA